MGPAAAIRTRLVPNVPGLERSLTARPAAGCDQAALGIDALVCPGLALPAFRHGDSEKLNQACSYTYIWCAGSARPPCTLRTPYNTIYYPERQVPIPLQKVGT